MNKKDIIDFFNSKASVWDDESIRDDIVISYILDEAEVTADKAVLDIACGTGFLFDDYFKRGISSLTGIDISPEMIKICSEKYPEAFLVCGDAENYTFNSNYDVIIIHNAFPHFCSPDKLFSNLVKNLNSKGRITVSHDMSRNELNSFHNKHALKVSEALPEAKVLAEMMNKYVLVDKIISNDKMYLVSGIKN